MTARDGRSQRWISMRTAAILGEWFISSLLVLEAERDPCIPIPRAVAAMAR